MRRRPYRIATGSVALGGAIAVWLLATQVFPYHSVNHDEGVYLQQAAMLLEGQLSLRPPVEELFRPWFFVEDGNRLYPKYTPVPAALFAVGKLLGGYRLALAGIAGGILLLTVAVTTEVFDRQTGLVAGGLMLVSPLFLIDTAVFLPYAPTSLLNLLFAYGYLRTNRTGSQRWAAVAGGAIGLAFFARPYTAVLFALPFIGHALWSLARDWRETIGRQLTIGGLGTAGVAVALGYNAFMTGSPLLFPYEAFAPADGLGFGHRELLNHEIQYTPELAVRANSIVVERLFTEWIAGGIVGLALVLIGIAGTARHRPSTEQITIGGLFVSIIAGNVYFWGNFNILGGLDRTGDGLVAALGPYYHFDILLPTAAFGAAGLVWIGQWVYRRASERGNHRTARAVVGIVLIVSAGAVGAVTAQNLDDRVDENMATTDTYERAYQPFETGPPAQSLVLLPDPYGDWLNHPFQPLRNDPGFDGTTVYALNDRPFAVIDEFPNRERYRYVYRGPWAPHAGSPEAARLQSIQDVSGSSVQLATTLGIPDGAIGVTTRIGTDAGSTYYVAPNVSTQLNLTLTVTNDTVTAGGTVRSTGNGTIGIAGQDIVRVTVFVDYGAGSGFEYRFELPVNATGTSVRALTPRTEYCRNARACGGAAAYIPATTPSDIFVRSSLQGANHTA